MGNSKREYNKKYYEEHREELLAKKREYYRQHRERELAQKRKYYRLHSEEIRGKRGEYYQNHKEQVVERSRKYYNEHRLLEEFRKRRNEVTKKWHVNNNAEILKRVREYDQMRQKRDKVKIRARQRLRSSPHLYPLDSNCVFCGDAINLQHGHIDYDEPTIYLTVCGSCNLWMGIPN